MYLASFFVLILILISLSIGVVVIPSTDVIISPISASSAVPSLTPTERSR